MAGPLRHPAPAPEGPLSAAGLLWAVALWATPPLGATPPALWTSVPSAAEPTDTERAVLVVPMVVGEGVRAGALEAAVAEAARGRRGLRLMTSEEAFVSGGDLDALRACGGDSACMSKRLARAGAELAVLVLVNTLSEPPLVALWLLELKGGATRPGAAAPLTEASVVEAVRQRAARALDEAGFVRRTRVLVEVTPADARVEVVGAAAPDAARPGVFEVTPGAWQVRASRPGYTTVERAVEAPEGVDTAVTLVLEEDTAWWTSPWFWGAVATAAVAGGVTAVVVGTSGGGRCVCLGGPAQTCPPC